MYVKGIWHISNCTWHSPFFLQNYSTQFSVLHCVLEGWLVWTTSMGSIALCLLVGFDQWEYHQEIRGGDKRVSSICFTSSLPTGVEFGSDCVHPLKAIVAVRQPFLFGSSSSHLWVLCLLWFISLHPWIKLCSITPIECAIYSPARVLLVTQVLNELHFWCPFQRKRDNVIIVLTNQDETDVDWYHQGRNES